MKTMKYLLTGLMLTFGMSLSIEASDVVVLDKLSVENLALQLVEAEESEFEQTVFALGRVIDIPSHGSMLSSRISGRVVELYAHEGDTVNEGQVLVKVETRQLGNPPPKIELKAMRSGMVIASHTKVGEPVEPEKALMEIVDRSKVWVSVQIPERYVASIKTGAKARMKIPALGDRVFTSSLKRFGVQSSPDSVTVEGIFELNNKDRTLIPGMRVEVSIITVVQKNVLSIPIEAVQGDPARRFVFVEDFNLPYAYQKVPVFLGLQNDQKIQVLKGLFPGDRVVTRGSYALSFSGGSSGMSLKEALDAAHGHEHNEDGSEITPEQRMAKQKAHQHDDAHDHHHKSGSTITLWLVIYAVAMTLLSLILFQVILKRRQQEVEGA